MLYDLLTRRFPGDTKIETQQKNVDIMDMNNEISQPIKCHK